MVARVERIRPLGGEWVCLIFQKAQRSELLSARSGHHCDARQARAAANAAAVFSKGRTVPVLDAADKLAVGSPGPAPEPEG